MINSLKEVELKKLLSSLKQVFEVQQEILLILTEQRNQETNQVGKDNEDDERVCNGEDKVIKVIRFVKEEEKLGFTLIQEFLDNPCALSDHKSASPCQKLICQRSSCQSLSGSYTFIVNRVLKGSYIHKKGILREGDELIEINGRNLVISFNTAQQIQDYLSCLKGEISLKVKTIRKSPLNRINECVVYLRALINYDPEKDEKISCKEIGMRFEIGTIMKVTSKVRSYLSMLNRSDI